jgi:hypothetical protein
MEPVAPASTPWCVIICFLCALGSGCWRARCQRSETDGIPGRLPFGPPPSAQPPGCTLHAVLQPAHALDSRVVSSVRRRQKCVWQLLDGQVRGLARESDRTRKRAANSAACILAVALGRSSRPTPTLDSGSPTSTWPTIPCAIDAGPCHGRCQSRTTGPAAGPAPAPILALCPLAAPVSRPRSEARPTAEVPPRWLWPPPAA